MARNAPPARGGQLDTARARGLMRHKAHGAGHRCSVGRPTPLIHDGSPL
jgi:hypothetical protein